MNINIDLNNKILIIPNNLKKKIVIYINNLNTLTNTKIITIEEFIKNLTIDYNEKTIYYLFKEKKLSYEVAKENLINMKYIENNKNYNTKLTNLKNLKEELLNKGLITINNHFINYIKDKEIIFYGFTYIDRFTKKLIKDYNLNVKIIEDMSKNINHDVLLFENSEEEIEFIAEDIINRKLDLNKTYIYGINSDNLNKIKRIFRSYNLNINIKKNTSLYDTHIGLNFLNNLNNQEYLEKINNQDIKNQLISIINKYHFVKDLNEIKELIKKELQNTKIKNKKLKNAINEIDILNNKIDDDEYIYIINFNSEYIPVLNKDTNFICDNEKPEFLETSIELNNLNKENLNKAIKNIKNLTITASENNDNGKLNISLVATENNYNIINMQTSYSTHSHKINRYNLCKILDNYLKYNEENKHMEILLNTYKDINYRTFDNKYKKVDITHKNIKLSYSKMNTYYTCPFKYYCENILKLKKYEDTFDTHLGSLCHYILSKIYTTDFNFDIAKEEYLTTSNYTLTNEDKLFQDKILEELKEAIKYILSNQKITKFNEIECEKEINTIIDNTSFIGIIDKIQKYENKIIVTDYKTGTPKIDLKLCKYGLNLQLPTYIYLIKQIYPDSEIVGVYLMHILKPKFNYDLKNIDKDNYEESLKLQGYTISNEDIIEEIDSTYENSTMIKSLKKTSSGFSKYSKLLSKEEFEDLEKLAKEKIEETIENIKNNNFDIKPIILDGINISCPNCEFKDICHHTEKDYIYINNKEGEENND